MKQLTAVAAAIAIITLQGCATKTYGRQDVMTSQEKDSMICQEIDLDVAKTREFIDRVNKESAFSGLDVVAILVDFGIGNYLEKTSALESADTRLAALRDMRAAKKCDAALM